MEGTDTQLKRPMTPIAQPHSPTHESPDPLTHREPTVEDKQSDELAIKWYDADELESPVPPIIREASEEVKRVSQLAIQFYKADEFELYKYGGGDCGSCPPIENKGEVCKNCGQICPGADLNWPYVKICGACNGYDHHTFVCPNQHKYKQWQDFGFEFFKKNKLF